MSAGGSDPKKAPEAKVSGSGGGGGAVAKRFSQEMPDINSELEWIRFREDVLGPAAYSEQPSSKFYRKMTENPFVPIGAFATFGALSYGLWCFRQGRARDSQLMMRARIGAQGFTIFAILAGIAFGYSDHRKSSNPVGVEAAPANPVKDVAKS